MKQEASRSPGRRGRLGILALLVPMAIGVSLRLWHLGDQIPFDDEWHALSYILDHDVAYLFTHYTRLGANSTPHNLYLRLALTTVGLSEWSIVLPSLVGGIALLWCYPRWVWLRFGALAGVVSGALLAIAPYLVFHSRFARPYGPLLLVEFLAFQHLCQWTESGRRRDLVLAYALGVLAVWLHATALAPTVAAWAAAGFVQWRVRWRTLAPASPPTAPSPKKIGLVGIAMLATAAALSIPAFVPQAYPAATASAPFSRQTWEALGQLVCGNAWAPTQALVVALMVFGLWLSARRAPKELLVFGSAAFASFTLLLAIHPLQCEVGAIFARYALPVFLLPPLAIGVAVQALVNRIKAQALRRVAVLALVPGLPALLYFSGPLPFVQTGVTSFTKHAALQYNYADFDGSISKPDPVVDQFPPIARSQLHPFYLGLAGTSGDAPIIEYPFVIGEDFNRLYFAQLSHHRPVLAGYYASGAGWTDTFGLALGPGTEPRSRPPSRGYLLSAMTLDHVLGPVAPSAQIRFHTVVDITDMAALKASGADYLLLHWNLAREFFFFELLGQPGGRREKFVEVVRQQLTAQLGQPMIDDGILTVYRLTRPAGSWPSRRN